MTACMLTLHTLGTVGWLAFLAATAGLAGETARAHLNRYAPPRRRAAQERASMFASGDPGGSAALHYADPGGFVRIRERGPVDWQAEGWL